MAMKRNSPPDLRQDLFPASEPPHGEVHPIGEVLAELLAQYERRFPEVSVRVVQEAAATAP